MPPAEFEPGMAADHRLRQLGHCNRQIVTTTTKIKFAVRSEILGEYVAFTV